MARLQTVAVAETLLVALPGSGPWRVNYKLRPCPVATRLALKTVPLSLLVFKRILQGSGSWLIHHVRELAMRAMELLNIDKSRSEQCWQHPEVDCFGRPKMYEEMFSAQEDRMRIVDGTEPASSSRIMGHATVALLQP